VFVPPPYPVAFGWNWVCPAVTCRPYVEGLLVCPGCACPYWRVW
jgi:hypothetical protein